MYLIPIALLLQGAGHLVQLSDALDTSWPAGVIVVPGTPTSRPIRWNQFYISLAFAVGCIVAGLITLWYARIRVFMAVDRDALSVRTGVRVRTALWSDIKKVVQGTTYTSFHVRGARKIILKKPLIRTPYDDFVAEAVRRWEACQARVEA